MLEFQGSPKVEGRVLQVRLVGTNTCHRYQLMRETATEEAVRLGIPTHLIEEPEVEGIMRYQTVNLPLLFVGGEQIAQGNGPSRRTLREHLRRNR